MSSSLFSLDTRAHKTPVFVLTGFLGSGKTTLLNRLLRDPACADTAVIVNELGAVALDHLLVERLDGEVMLLPSGCLCCSVRSDLEQTLRELLARRDEGSVPPFARVVVETTGLADPAPLVQLLDVNPLVSHFCTLGAVLVTVDAVNAPHQLAHQWEARKQVALADTLIVTKRDIAGASSDAVPDLLRALNPRAELCFADALEAPADLLKPHAGARGVLPVGGLFDSHAGRLQPLHGDVATLVLEADAPLDWLRLQRWLAELRQSHGEQLLRLKGVVRVADEPDPLVLHGVHHLFHPPVRAPGLDWPAGRSALVLIVHKLDAEPLREGFAQCVAQSSEHGGLSVSNPS